MGDASGFEKGLDLPVFAELAVHGDEGDLRLRREVEGAVAADDDFGDGQSSAAQGLGDGVAGAEGDFALMGEDRLKLSYLPVDTALLVGDYIVTSGLGGYYPSNLVIGTVESVEADDNGLAQYAVLAPMLDFDDLTEVFVIKAFDIVE